MYWSSNLSKPLGNGNFLPKRYYHQCLDNSMSVIFPNFRITGRLLLMGSLSFGKWQCCTERMVTFKGGSRFLSLSDHQFFMILQILLLQQIESYQCLGRERKIHLKLIDLLKWCYWCNKNLTYYYFGAWNCWENNWLICIVVSGKSMVSCFHIQFDLYLGMGLQFVIFCKRLAR